MNGWVHLPLLGPPHLLINVFSKCIYTAHPIMHVRMLEGLDEPS